MPIQEITSYKNKARLQKSKQEAHRHPGVRECAVDKKGKAQSRYGNDDLIPLYIDLAIQLVFEKEVKRGGEYR